MVRHRRIALFIISICMLCQGSYSITDFCGTLGITSEIRDKHVIIVAGDFNSSLLDGHEPARTRILRVFTEVYEIQPTTNSALTTLTFRQYSGHSKCMFDGNA